MYITLILSHKIEYHSLRREFPKRHSRSPLVFVLGNHMLFPKPSDNFHQEIPHIRHDPQTHKQVLLTLYKVFL